MSRKGFYVIVEHTGTEMKLFYNFRIFSNKYVSFQNSDKSQTCNKAATKDNDEKQLRNTFGWARIEVLMMLVVCVLFASLCFSVLIEALQTLVHIDHMDAMHYPKVVFTVGVFGLVLNIFCYIIIGGKLVMVINKKCYLRLDNVWFNVLGYTFHQGSFLHVNENGDVVLDSVASIESVRQGQRGLSRSRHAIKTTSGLHERQGWIEITRDMTSTNISTFLCIYIFLSNI